MMREREKNNFLTLLKKFSGCEVKCRKRGLLYVLQQWPVFPPLVRVRSKMLELKIYNKYFFKKREKRKLKEETRHDCSICHDRGGKLKRHQRSEL
jgi:hypothetical protein